MRLQAVMQQTLRADFFFLFSPLRLQAGVKRTKGGE